MSAANLRVERVERATDEVRDLIRDLDAELMQDYEPEQRHGYDVERVFQPDVRFFIVRLDGAAVGCGAVGFDDGFAELKRMFVRPAMRGRGVVQVLLERLEAEAVVHGYRRLMLETGDTLFPAMKVYERAGFRRCGAFGHYAALEPHRIVRSVFMEKAIG